MSHLSIHSNANIALGGVNLTGAAFNITEKSLAMNVQLLGQIAGLKAAVSGGVLTATLDPPVRYSPGIDMTVPSITVAGLKVNDFRLNVSANCEINLTLGTKSASGSVECGFTFMGVPISFTAPFSGTIPASASELLRILEEYITDNAYDLFKDCFDPGNLQNILNALMNGILKVGQEIGKVLVDTCSMAVSDAAQFMDQTMKMPLADIASAISATSINATESAAALTSYFDSQGYDAGSVKEAINASYTADVATKALDSVSSYCVSCVCDCVSCVCNCVSCVSCVSSSSGW